MVAPIAHWRCSKREVVLKNNELKQKVQDACTQHRFKGVRDLFVAAFESLFGKRRGVRKEARNAAAKFSTSGLLTDRARNAVMRFIALLTSGGATAAAA